MNPLTVTLIQTNLYWEDVAANLDMFTQKVSAVTAPVQLLVLPEMFSTGFSMQAAKLAEGMDGRAVQWMKKTAAEKQCVVTGSLMIKDEGRYYNRLVWMRPDGTYATYNKRHLFTLAGEENIYTPGEERIVVELNGWRICPLVCYDLRFPVWSRNRGEYDVLLYVANWPQRRSYHWKQLLIARAIENQCYTIGLNRVGNDGNDVYHSGDSLVVDPVGNLLYHKIDEEDITHMELHYAHLQQVRTQFRFLNDADDFEINPKRKFKSH